MNILNSIFERCRRRLACMIIGSLSFLVVVSLVLVACSGSPAGRVVPTLIAGTGGVDLAALGSKADNYFNGGVSLEKNATNNWANYVQTQNTFRTGVTDLFQNKKSCYKDVAATEVLIGQAVMGQESSATLINALAVQSVSGEAATSLCVGLNVQLADYVVSHRQAVQDAYMTSFTSATDLMEYTSNFIEIDMMNDLMDTYGSTPGVYKFLAEHNVPGISDWTWLPTKNLWVVHSSQELCNYYRSGEFKQNLLTETLRKFKGHEDSLDSLYATSWNPAANGGKGECRMYRYAALEYMTRQIVSAGTADVVEGGEDTGAIPTDVPESPNAPR